MPAACKAGRFVHCALHYIRLKLPSPLLLPTGDFAADVTWMRCLIPFSVFGLVSLALHVPNFETVATSNGEITGHRSPMASEVWEYLGIPYAQPPLGEQRFAVPKEYTSKEAASRYLRWSEPLLFINNLHGSDCPQQAAIQPDFPGFTPQAKSILNLFTASAGTQRSEDCLTLNIWSKPSLKSLVAKKPVFVLFHGGRFAGGNTNTPFANGQYLANNTDTIVVSVNYRLNIFGFPGGPNTDTNLGLRDQRLAVQWIQKNIIAFGGDAKKIVIAGQSSGGAAVDWWSYAYPQDPIVHGLMSTSGNAFSFPLNSHAKQVENWSLVSSLVGCNNTANATTTLSCMRSIPWHTLSLAASKIPPTPGGSPVRSTPPFYPIVDNETIFSPTTYPSLASTGRFAKLPYFHGHNDNEQGYYVIPAFAQGRNVTNEQAQKFLFESFVCPVSYEARARTAAGVKSWTYRYFGDWENTRLYPTSGAYHGSELHMILGGAEDMSGLPMEAAQKDTVTLVQSAVAAFTEDPEEGLLELGWPVFEPGRESWVQIAKGNSAGVGFVRAETYDAGCEEVVMGALQGES
ncbi:triacylglycerol lipase V precursor [Pyrenophora seminiperda CCB06]|uniref:Carboxylic ester hydrolase n=1 Tax=Pyrenophora seminiperda CCB06 TaxID=1302712 RepID=A0A3M7M7A7_9PLEO|nr:triacylglycerol lipase V precursor [Pyrenophora seminiperda CCB06]